LVPYFAGTVVPAAASTQDVQDAVEQAAGVTSGSADVRLCWREVLLDNLPEIIVNFPEGHDFVCYLKGLIILGQPPYYTLTSGANDPYIVVISLFFQRQFVISCEQLLNFMPRKFLNPCLSGFYARLGPSS
jgi:hypothetical protein